MKKKNVLKRLLCLMAVVALLTPSVVALASSAEHSYTDYVYGSRYVTVVNGLSTVDMGGLEVSISDIRQADGTSSNYSKVKADVLDKSGNQLCVRTEYTLYKGKTTMMTLLAYLPQGTQMLLRMKGNKDYLDCYVDYSVYLEEIGADEI